ncbi:hypothetical protein TNCV_3814381 [Trichonephila clavipes]|nr:hypothetical protein TNCV_3814381 [Trichonephila clavipes]
MVRGAISFDSRTPLDVIRGTLTAQRCVDDILRTVLLSFLLQYPGRIFSEIMPECFVDNKQWGLAMSDRSRLPDLLRWRAVEWIEMGLSQAAAAMCLNVSRSVVHLLWNQYQTEASVSRRHV